MLGVQIILHNYGIIKSSRLAARPKYWVNSTNNLGAILRGTPADAVFLGELVWNSGRTAAHARASPG